MIFLNKSVQKNTFFTIILPVISLSLALSMSVFNANITNVALPYFSETFNVSTSKVIWIVNAYQIVIMASLLAFASLGEILGLKKIFLFGIVVFVLGSAFCAFSSEFYFLIASRILQGLGASAISSVNYAQLKSIYPRKYEGIGFAINAMIISVSAAMGPPIAGVIISFASWQWIFFINITIGIIAFFLGKITLKTKHEQNDSKFDWQGAFLNACFFTFLILFIDGINHTKNIYFLIIELFICVISGYFLFKNLKSVKKPLIDIHLFKNKIFSFAIISSIFSFGSQMLILVCLPFAMSFIFDLSATKIGLIIAPWAISSFIFSPIIGIFSMKIWGEFLGAIGMIILCITCIGFALIDKNTPILDIVILTSLCGVGYGFFRPANNATIITSADKNKSSQASGILASARVFGQTFGTSICAFCFAIDKNDGFYYSVIIAGIFALLSAFFAFRAGFYKFNLSENKK